MITEKVKNISEKGYDISLYFYADPSPWLSLLDIPGVFRCYLPEEYIDSVKGRPGIEYIAITDYINKRPDPGIPDGFDGKTVTNIGDFSELSSGILCGDLSLNIYNSHTLEAYDELADLSSLTLSPELSFKDQMQICKNSEGLVSARPEIIVSGRIPVMRSEHCFLSNKKADPKAPCKNCGNCRMPGRFYLEDEKKRSYPVIPLPKTCQSVLLSSYEIDHTEEVPKAEDTGLKTSPVMRFNIFDDSF